MKLWSFTSVKNEEDIIESFVRYNMNILDGMVISDNCSNDNTLKILKKLKKEGYNIDILEDKNKLFDQVKKRNDLLKYTYKTHKPDFIFPLDADEFIATDEDVNPRKIIEKYDTNLIYKYKMKNYILDGNETDDLFIPKRMSTIRITEEEENCNYKCIVSKSIDIDTANLAMGSHTVYTESGDEMPFTVADNLFLAHYPVRSSEQVMAKVIVGRLNNAKLHSREEGTGFHQYEILDEIIKDGTLSKKTLYDISKYYSYRDHTQEIISEVKPLNTNFCKKLDIKYYDNTAGDRVLINTLITSFSIVNEMREEIKELRKEKDKYGNKEIIDKLHEDLDNYKKNYEEIINSKGWKFIESLRNLKKFGRK